VPFGMVNGLGRVMGVLDGVVIVEGKGSFGGEFGHPIVLCCVVVREQCALPKFL